MALVPGSAALNAGDPSFAAPPGPATDQRGAGYARVALGRLDIGAYEAQQAYNISGTVTVNGSPAAGVTLTLTGGSGASATTTTLADGSYAFNVPAGSFTVTPNLANTAFAPLAQNVRVSATSLQAQDFAGTRSGGDNRSQQRAGQPRDRP
jgi:hypothetical protein